MLKLYYWFNNSQNNNVKLNKDIHSFKGSRLLSWFGALMIYWFYIFNKKFNLRNLFTFYKFNWLKNLTFVVKTKKSNLVYLETYLLLITA